MSMHPSVIRDTFAGWVLVPRTLCIVACVNAAFWTEEWVGLWLAGTI